MTPFAIIVTWNGQSASIEEVADLLDPVRDRCTDGTTGVVVPGAAVAVGVRAVVPGEDLAAGLLIENDRRRLIVGDIRLYGREALASQLGADAGGSDINLVARAIDRFAMDAPSQLVGDFAFVVWDWGQRNVWAARDHFGLRPLHYRIIPEGLAFATDVRQLLRLRSQRARAEPDVDLDMVLNYLLDDRGHRSRTYFRGIRQVRPAHRLTAIGGLPQETRYWWPPRELNIRLRYADYVDEWRDLFRTAVTDRLRSAHPVAAHLSGGLDSGSIVGVAHEFYEASVDAPQPFLTLSALFPGLDCDETPYIDAALQRTPLFESARWNGCAYDPSDFDAPLVQTPGIPRGPRAGPWRDLEAARERGARVLLTGDGGDEVGWARGVFRDLVQRGRFLTFAREVAAPGSWARRRRRFLDGLRGVVPPTLIDLWRGKDRVRSRAPEWLGPDLVKIFPGSPDDDERDDLQFNSHLQRQIWRVFSSPRAFAALDVLFLVAAESGVEVRAPFLDVRLVNLVLAIPWHFRLPHGDMRRLERDGVRPFVAPIVANRMVKPVFASAIYNQIRLNLTRIRQIIHDPVWASAPFVCQQGAKKGLEECLARDPGVLHWRPWRQVWKFASFEAWLRGVRAYNAR